MNRRILCFIFCKILTLTSPLTGAKAENKTKKFETYGLIESEISSSLKSSSIQKSEIIFNSEISIQLEKFDFTALLRIREDFNNLYNGKENPNSSFSSFHFDRNLLGTTHGELREFYADVFIDNISLRIGKQQVVWGQTDGLKVLDVINPQSFQEFILDDFESSRIPLWTLNADIPLNQNVSLQFLWIPDLTYHELPSTDSLFAFRSPLLTLASLNSGEISSIRKLNPKNIFRDSDLGFQVTFFQNGWDITANYFYHYDDFPVSYQDGVVEDFAIVTSYRRNHLLGGSLTKAFRNLVLRSEYGYSNNKYFITRDSNGIIGYSVTPEFKVALALDYNADSEWFISGQVLLSDINKSKSKFIRDKLESSATLLLRKGLFNDSLVFENFLIHSFNNNDGVFRPKVIYEYESNISVWGGFDIFYGDSFGYFGQFNDLDRFNLGLKIGI